MLGSAGVCFCCCCCSLRTLNTLEYYCWVSSECPKKTNTLTHVQKRRDTQSDAHCAHSENDNFVQTQTYRHRYGIAPAFKQIWLTDKLVQSTSNTHTHKFMCTTFAEQHEWKFIERVMNALSLSSLYIVRCAHDGARACRPAHSLRLHRNLSLKCVCVRVAKTNFNWTENFTFPSAFVWIVRFLHLTPSQMDTSTQTLCHTFSSHSLFLCIPMTLCSSINQSKVEPQKSMHCERRKYKTPSQSVGRCAEFSHLNLLWIVYELILSLSLIFVTQPKNSQILHKITSKKWEEKKATENDTIRFASDNFNYSQLKNSQTLRSQCICFG